MNSTIVSTKDIFMKLCQYAQFRNEFDIHYETRQVIIIPPDMSIFDTRVRYRNTYENKENSHRLYTDSVTNEQKYEAVYNKFSADDLRKFCSRYMHKHPEQYLIGERNNLKQRFIQYMQDPKFVQKFYTTFGSSKVATFDEYEHLSPTDPKFITLKKICDAHYKPPVCKIITSETETECYDISNDL